MAVLALEYRFNDGIGGAVADTGAYNNPGIIVPWGSYPKAVSGQEGGGAFEFSGLEDWNSSLTYPERVYSTNTIACNRTLGLTIVAAFKVRELYAPRLIFGGVSYDPNNSGTRVEMADGLYVGDDAHIYFGDKYTSGGGGQIYVRAVRSDSPVDTGWHVAVGRRKPFNVLTGTYDGTMELWLDGRKQQATNGPLTDLYNIHTYSPYRGVVGYGYLGRPDSSAIAPGTSTNFINGTFGGTVDYCQFYCGEVSDADIEGLSGAIAAYLSPDSLAALGTVFDHPTIKSPCVYPSSNARCLAPSAYVSKPCSSRSTVRLIPNNR